MKYWLIGILFTCCWYFSVAQKIEFEGLNDIECQGIPDGAEISGDDSE